MISKLTVVFVAIAAAAFGDTISIDTSSLEGNINAPFTLDLQLSDGSGSNDGNNTVTLSDFNVGSGSLTLASTSGGGVFSNSPLQVQLTDNSFFNDVQFTIDPGATLSFDLSATSNADAGTPDVFTLAILDSGYSDLPTSNVNNGIALVEYDFPTVSPTGTAELILSGTNSTFDGVTIPTPQTGTLSSTPEPSGIFWMALLVPVIGLIRRFRVSD